MAPKLEELGIDAFCERIEAGDSQAAIARSLGISKALVTAWIDADPERSARVRESRTRSSESLYEIAHENIVAAADPFELAKAKEEAQHLRRWAAIRNPVYGDKVSAEITGKDGGAIKHDHTVELSAETAGLLASLKAGSSDSGDEVSV